MSFDPEKHPRGQPGNAGQFAEVDSKAARVEQWNSKLSEVVKATGQDEWAIIESLFSTENHDEQMAAMDAMIATHDGKPKAWEPENPYDMTQFETGDWESPEKAADRKEWWEQYNKVRTMFRDALVESEIDNKKKAENLSTAMKVIQRMPTQALMALMANATKTQFYSSLEDLTKSMSGKGMRTSGVIGGCWAGSGDSASGVLHLDGGFKTPGSIDSRGIYSHEFGHACDWHDGNQRERKTAEGTYYEGAPAGEISSTTEWRAAFDAELSTGQLSKYGATSPSEGFAEFARLCWGTDQRPKDIATDYPQCFKVFQKRGLMR